MSRYFIDTNVFLFFALERSNLTYEVIDIISDYSNQIYMSSRAVDEVIQLFHQGKLKVNKHWKTAEGIVDFIKNDAGFEVRYIKEEHLRTLAELPLFEDHKDPSDRMIIAHAINDKIPLISSDRKFHLYQKYGLEFVYNKR